MSGVVVTLRSRAVGPGRTGAANAGRRSSRLSLGRGRSLTVGSARLRDRSGTLKRIRGTALGGFRGQGSMRLTLTDCRPRRPTLAEVAIFGPPQRPSYGLLRGRRRVGPSNRRATRRSWPRAAVMRFRRTISSTVSSVGGAGASYAYLHSRHGKTGFLDPSGLLDAEHRGLWSTDSAGGTNPAPQVSSLCSGGQA